MTQAFPIQQWSEVTFFSSPYICIGNLAVLIASYSVNSYIELNEFDWYKPTIGSSVVNLVFIVPAILFILKYHLSSLINSILI